MKKLSERHARLLIKRARRGTFKGQRKLRKSVRTRTSTKIVEVWDGANVERVICRGVPSAPPETLCFEENTDETLKFLSDLRQKVRAAKSAQKNADRWIERRRGRLPSVVNYIDFSKIGTFATGPALVVGALYERAKEATGQVPPAVDFPNWSSQAFQTLYELGFFEVIGHAPAEMIREVYVEKQDSSYKVSKILSGRNADGLEDASDVVLELLQYLNLDPSASEELITEINSAVSEAMINVARHAYPEGFADSGNLVCLRKWWMSAKADRESNMLTIAIYDQGATIPSTLPEREWFREPLETLMKVINPNYESGAIDHEFINYSMKKGKTQTDHARRGLGLPQMRDLIDACPDGTLSILSRRGLYKYGKRLGVFKRPLNFGIEGTLIEWELILPQGRGL